MAEHYRTVPVQPLLNLAEALRRPADPAGVAFRDRIAKAIADTGVPFADVYTVTDAVLNQLREEIRP